MSEYRVLARKYRPQNFDDLVGQDVLVRTISNAIKNNRIAHAFLLTGIRGIGKTTTARIIARALNCIGEDGNGGATISPCGVCPNCIQIKEDKHVDVLEMDAASRTGVDSIRSLIETVQYPPVSARYKIYIIDEVHMLTNNAFNALLKTLEEPPANVKFIFATTELNKIPVTILSRCQRFDLRRLDVEELTTHLQNICAKEDITADEKALKIIAISAEGSVRDGLSLLDRAISQSFNNEEQEQHISTALVRDMLAVSDRYNILVMLESLFAGDINAALKLLEKQYYEGTDISLIFADILSSIHLMTRFTINPKEPIDASYSEEEKKKSKELASKLSIQILARAWQILLKGSAEIKMASNALMAAEMVLIRFAHMADAPPPNDLLKKIKEEEAQNGAHTVAPHSTPPASGGTTSPQHYNTTSAPSHTAQSMALPSEAPVAMAAAAPTHLTLAANNPAIQLQSFEEVAEFFKAQKEMMLYHTLRSDVGLIAFEQGNITLKALANVTPSNIKQIRERLNHATGTNWSITLGEGEASSTLAEQQKVEQKAEISAVEAHPLVKTILDEFSDSNVVKITSNDSEENQ